MLIASLTDLIPFWASDVHVRGTQRPKKELDLLDYEQNMQLKVTEVKCVHPPLVLTSLLSDKRKEKKKCVDYRKA